MLPACQPEELRRVYSVHARVVFKKCIQREAVIKVVKQGLSWHPSPNEHQRTTENLRVRVYWAPL
jgi:hypothetical protein